MYFPTTATDPACIVYAQCLHGAFPAGPGTASEPLLIDEDSDKIFIKAGYTTVLIRV